MNNAQQLVKKERGGGYRDIFPKSYTENIRDKESGEYLDVTLAKINFLFLPYHISKEHTRLQVPFSKRRRGLWISYVIPWERMVIEYYLSDNIEDSYWQSDAYWFDTTGTIVDPDIAAAVEQIKEYVDAEIINNTSLNPEDLERNEDKQIQFSDKEYDTSAFSGLGRVYLRKNISNGKNVLTQEMISDTNTRYIIQYDYDLNGQTITIPENCVLQFEGGSIKNGTINCNGTVIVGKFGGNATITGTYSFQDAQADEEDITQNQSSVLKFKDRKYEPDKYSGLGRVILRKNIVEVEDPIYGKITKNILFQDMIAQANTIYEIRYDYNLNGNTVTIPEGCVLDFQGGSLNNGSIIGNKTTIIASIYKIFDLSIDLRGTWNVSEAYPEWFGAKGDGVTDDTDAVYKCISIAKLQGGNVMLSTCYLITRTIYLPTGVNILGNFASSYYTSRTINNKPGFLCSFNNVNSWCIDFDHVDNSGNRIAYNKIYNLGDNIKSSVNTIKDITIGCDCKVISGNSYIFDVNKMIYGGIRLAHCVGSIIENVNIEFTKIGLAASVTWNNIINHNSFEVFMYGIVISTGTNNTISNCLINNRSQDVTIFKPLDSDSLYSNITTAFPTYFDSKLMTCGILIYGHSNLNIIGTSVQGYDLGTSFGYSSVSIESLYLENINTSFCNSSHTTLNIGRLGGSGTRTNRINYEDGTLKGYKTNECEFFADSFSKVSIDLLIGAIIYDFKSDTSLQVFSLSEIALCNIYYIKDAPIYTNITQLNTTVRDVTVYNEYWGIQKPLNFKTAIDRLFIDSNYKKVNSIIIDGLNSPVTFNNVEIRLKSNTYKTLTFTDQIILQGNCTLTLENFKINYTGTLPLFKVTVGSNVTINLGCNGIISPNSNILLEKPSNSTVVINSTLSNFNGPILEITPNSYNFFSNYDKLTFNSPYLKYPVTSGTTTTRDSLATNGMLFRWYQFYDTTIKKLIIWNGSEWTNLDGTALT